MHGCGSSGLCASASYPRIVKQLSSDTWLPSPLFSQLLHGLRTHLLIRVNIGQRSHKAVTPPRASIKAVTIRALKITPHCPIKSTPKTLTMSLTNVDSSPEGVHSLLDTDLYKLTMQCAVLRSYPDAGTWPWCQDEEKLLTA
jgi:hypothetical protein